MTTGRRTDATGPSTRWRLAAACLAAAMLLLAAYSNFFRNAFHFDDGHVLVENLYIRSLANVPRFFTDAGTFSKLPANATYRPLCSFSLALDYALAGRLDPVVFHASQLAQMALLCLALGFFFRRAMDAALPDPANRYLALFAAALFGVHTLHTETMNLMHARSEILSALGVVAAFLIYWRGGWPRRVGLHLVAMALGALAKPPAVIFGPLLFLWVLFEPRGSSDPASGFPARWSARLRAALAAAAVPTAAGAVVFVLISRLDGPGVNYGGGDRFHYLLTQSWAWLHYLRLLVLPRGLSADTDLKLIRDWYDTRVVAGALVVGLLAWGALRAARSRRAWLVAFGVAWFALGLAPASSVIPLAEPINEHRPFLGTIGLVLAATWAARLGYLRLRDGGRGMRWLAPAAVAGCLAILVAHAVGTHERNKAWRDSPSLWGDVTRKSPENGRGWMNYGLTFMTKADYVEARRCFERARALTPNYSVLEINFGVLEGAAGNPVKAEEHFRRALTLAPNLPNPHFYFGRWLVGQGRAAEAIGSIETAVRLTPGFDTALDLLMDLQVARGNWPAARRVAESYLTLAPGYAKAVAYASGKVAFGPAATEAFQGHFDRGLQLGRQKRWLDSALAYRAALALDPQSADTLSNLGWTLGNLGFMAEAVQLLEEAVRLRPDHPLARNNLAWVRSLPRPAS